MAPRKRLSLAEIAKQDKNTTTPPAQSEAPLRAVQAPVATASRQPQQAPPVVSEIRNRKSDFVKISVTLPPEMHEVLQDLSHARRKRKERHMISDLVREALASWLPSQTS